MNIHMTVIARQSKIGLRAVKDYAAKEAEAEAKEVSRRRLAGRKGLRKMTEVVPFGTYKGQPVEALASDRQYCDWLAGQPWFRERFQNIYTVVVNNFAELSETPEHIALQALFLDDGFCERFIRGARFCKQWQIGARKGNLGYRKNCAE
jgi:hypothetical protein